MEFSGDFFLHKKVSSSDLKLAIAFAMKIDFERIFSNELMAECEN